MKIFRIIKLVSYIIFSVLVLVFAHFLVSELQLFIGLLLLAYAAFGIAESIIEEKKEFYQEPDFTFAILEMVLGVTILVLIDDYSTICVMWAVWSILREAFEVRDIFTKKHFGLLAIISIIESIVVIVLSILLIVNPGEHHAITHTYLLCVEMVLSCGGILADQYISHRDEAEIA